MSNDGRGAPPRPKNYDERYGSAHDPVNNPEHYKSLLGFESIDVIQAALTPKSSKASARAICSSTDSAPGRKVRQRRVSQRRIGTKRERNQYWRSVMNDSYDTLVVQGSTSKEIPREVNGARVCSWSSGHSIAEMSALSDFVNLLIYGEYDYHEMEEIKRFATEALEKSDRQRENGYEE